MQYANQIMRRSIPRRRSGGHTSSPLIPDRRETLQVFAVAERVGDCAVTNPHKVDPAEGLFRGAVWNSNRVTATFAS